MPSDVWSHFTKLLDEGKVKCKNCSAKFKYTQGGPTSGLQRHLLTTHKSLFIINTNEDRPECSQNVIQNQLVSPPPKRICLDKYVTKEAKPFSIVEERIMCFMIRQNLSFSSVEDCDLQEILRQYVPEYKPITRKKAAEMVPIMADNLMKPLVEKLKGFPFSITSDVWQKVASTPGLLSMTVHTINEEFQRSNDVLAVVPFAAHDRHTADIMKEMLSKVLNKHGMKFSRIVAAARDGAPSMSSLFNKAEIPSFQCAAHFLHNIVVDVLKTEPKVVKAIANLRKIVANLHRSNTSAIALKKYRKKNHFQSKKFQWMSKPGAIPTEILMVITSFTAALKKQLSDLELNKILCISMVLDPRFKYNQNIKSKEEWNRIEEKLIEFAYEWQSEMETETHQDDPYINPIPSIPSSCSLVSDDNELEPIQRDIFARLTERSEEQSQPLLLVDEKKQKYIDEFKIKLIHFRQLQPIPMDAKVEKVFEWYKGKKSDFPKIFFAARLLMSIPCTSVSSERLFSEAERLYANKLRNRLSGDRAQDLLLIKASLKRLKMAPAVMTEISDEESIANALIFEMKSTKEETKDDQSPIPFDDNNNDNYDFHLFN